MTPTRTSPRALALLLALVLATGCGSSTDDAPSAPGAAEGARDRASGSVDDRDRAPAPTASASPSATPSDSGGGARLDTESRAQRPSGRRTVAEPHPVRPRGNALTIREGGPDAHLVSAAALGRGWSVAGTADEGRRVMSPCHRATLADVGAQRIRLRDFEGPGTAVQAVARFVDRTSAWRIERVVSAWVADCERELERREAALGAVRHGRWLAVVEVAGTSRPAQRLADALAAAEATF